MLQIFSYVLSEKSAAKADAGKIPRVHFHQEGREKQSGGFVAFLKAM